LQLPSGKIDPDAAKNHLPDRQRGVARGCKMRGSLHLGWGRIVGVHADVDDRRGSMPKDSGADTNPDLAATGKRLIEDVEAEPVPDTLIKLARDLEAALAKKREDATAR
jgi:hypothetical protein